MRYYLVTHTHTSYVEAENEQCAREDLASQVRENAGADDCEAEEVSQEEHDKYWYDQLDVGKMKVYWFDGARPTAKRSAAEIPDAFPLDHHGAVMAANREMREERNERRIRGEI